MIRTLLILGALIAFCIPVYADIGNELITQILDTDLNGDGIDELIVMEYIDSEGHFTLKINDSSIDEWLEPYLSGFEIVDLDVDDGMIEILIHSPGPSDDPNCLIYAYDGENIIEVGHIWGIRKINSDGSIYIHVWRGFWFATEKYVLIPETHQLEIIPQELYYVDVWFTDQFETPGIVVMEPFPIYRNPDSEEIVEELEVNSTITIIACKPTFYVNERTRFILWDWYLIMSETGLLGWANFWDFYNKAEGFAIAD